MMELNDELKKYFGELSPYERKLMLEAISEYDDTDKDVSRFCGLLYDERYPYQKDSEHRMDKLLWKIVYLSNFCKRKRQFNFTIKKEVPDILKELHLADADSLGEIESTLLYHEFRNAAKRYLSTCGNPNYGSTFLGLKKADDDQKRLRACEDIWRASRGFAIASGEEHRLKLWCDALYDELMEYDGRLQTYYEKLERDNKLK